MNPDVENLLKLIGGFMANTPADTAPFEKGILLLQHFWDRFTATSAKECQNLYENGNIAELTNKIRSDADFFGALHYGHNQDIPSALAQAVLDAYDQWLVRLSVIDSSLPVRVNVLVAMGDLDEYKFTGIAWKKLSRHHRDLLLTGKLDEAEEFLTAMSEYLMNRKAIPPEERRKQNVLYRFLDREQKAFFALADKLPKARAKVKTKPELNSRARTRRGTAPFATPKRPATKTASGAIATPPSEPTG